MSSDNSPGWLVAIERKLYEKTEFSDMLARIESKIGIPRLYVVVGLVALLVGAFVIGNAALILCNVVGFAYPALASIKAIESGSTTGGEDVTKRWISYWILFAALAVFEFFAGFALAVIPFYSVLKCALLVWLLVPGPNNGSLFVYHHFLRPISLQVEDEARAILPPEAKLQD